MFHKMINGSQIAVKEEDHFDQEKRSNDLRRESFLSRCYHYFACCDSRNNTGMRSETAKFEYYSMESSRGDN